MPHHSHRQPQPREHGGRVKKRQKKLDEKLTQCEVLRVEPAQRKVPCSRASERRELRFSRLVPPLPSLCENYKLTHHVPHPRNSDVAPCTSYLALGVQSPDRLETRTDLWSEYPAHRVPRITIAVCTGKQAQSANKSESAIPSRRVRKKREREKK